MLDSSPSVFISYKFTGEDIDELKQIIREISESINKVGLGVFCSLDEEDGFQKKKMTADEIYGFCLEKQKQSEIFLAFIKSENESKGMSLELGKAIELKQKIVLAIKKGLAHDRFRSSAIRVIEYETLRDLYSILGSQVKEILE